MGYDSAKEGGGIDPASYTFNLLASILERLRVEVRDIHFRFHDEVSDPSMRFSAGITAVRLLACQEEELHSSSQFDYKDAKRDKLVQLQLLSIYWDRGVRNMGKTRRHVNLGTCSKSGRNYCS